MFAITVPADFGEQRFTWTITANNQQSEVSFWLNPAYFVDPFLNRANGNMPPWLRVGAGAEVQGPPVSGIAGTLAASVGELLALAASVRDVPLTNPPPPRAGREPPPAAILTWRLYRGPDEVTFDTGAEDTPENGRHEFAEVAGGDTTTWVSFSAPGEYRLIVTANDMSGNGGGGDQCCWTHRLRRRHRPIGVAPVSVRGRSSLVRRPPGRHSRSPLDHLLYFDQQK